MRPGTSIEITTFDAINYLVTPSTGSTSYFGGADLRNNHPYAYDYNATGLGTSLGSGSISFVSSTFTYTLPSDRIMVSGPLTFGFTENCANDVVLQTVNVVPEPGTILLLGTGLIGVAIFRKKKLSR